MTYFPIFVGAVFFPVTIPLLVTAIVMTVLAHRRNEPRLFYLACFGIVLYWQVLVAIACTIPARQGMVPQNDRAGEPQLA